MVCFGAAGDLSGRLGRGSMALLSFARGLIPVPANRPLPLAALIGFLSVLCLLFSLTVVISYLFEDSFVFGLLVSCPVVMMMWLWAQNRDTDRTPRTAVKLGRDIRPYQLPNNAKIMLALASSGISAG